jgi:hypothetical protein
MGDMFVVLTTGGTAGLTAGELLAIGCPPDGGGPAGVVIAAGSTAGVGRVAAVEGIGPAGVPREGDTAEAPDCWTGPVQGEPPRVGVAGGVTVEFG